MHLKWKITFLYLYALVIIIYHINNEYENICKSFAFFTSFHGSFHKSVTMALVENLRQSPWQLPKFGIWPDEHCPITTQLARIIISILQTFLVMHKSCKGNHLHLFHPDRLQPESLTCLIYFCCSQLSKMLDWSSVTFGSWLKKKMTNLDVMLIVIMKYAFAHGKHFKNMYGMKGQNSIFQVFFFDNFSFLLHINRFYILNYMIFHTISSYDSYSTVGF